MGNRIEDEQCVMCGDPLLYPFNQIRTCSVCEKIALRVVYETKMRQNDKSKNKNRTVLHRGQLKHSTEELGDRKVTLTS